MDRVTRFFVFVNVICEIGARYTLGWLCGPMDTLDIDPVDNILLEPQILGHEFTDCGLGDAMLFVHNLRDIAKNEIIAHGM